jgi:hypothetical protein
MVVEKRLSPAFLAFFAFRLRTPGARRGSCGRVPVAAGTRVSVEGWLF